MDTAEANSLLPNQGIIEQSGVIPYRLKDGKLEVMLITSRRRKRWVIPKGLIEWHMTAADSAIKEAWEEAGIWGTVTAAAVGSYHYHKWERTCRVEVYLLRVEHALDVWPEASFRKRKWFSPAKAAERVEEDELKQLLLRLPDVVK
jgi:8-oxo-dGTP pyrophosphatase MutT (NUDIX family)